MAWSQDEERMLAMIERHLTDEDPKLAARLESFNHRAGRGRQGRGAGRRRPGRSTVIIAVSWLLIATLIATLLVMALRHDAAALPV
ncbi:MULTISPECIES: DUF3040 domain-containing protein [Microbispora]|uniref:DUF3040 domain-containing protein n=2 Tax=Microbispora TaxID=2005 RepID=A0A5N6BMP4_9ACTN|nr:MULTISPECIES: DUF3040 domain-containing protein [Microbispora]KAB8181744.1 DUF3040 domain-containing protein [Microbispora catharanthi]MBE3013060.1 DUF3040 domain-containing protein [Microbispora sitophila]OPG13418.1 hypothetical protein B1L11_07960 [Microbispora sp. GKU 823]GIH64726.1 hypothetical protein Msi02_55430 [Microbispora siamensis]GLX09603.1 hypothetical protein Misp03_65290 [Microbispora sp. NBRC 16548]